MGPNIAGGKSVVLLFCFVLLTMLGDDLFAQLANRQTTAAPILIVGIEKTVEVLRAGSQRWDRAYTNQPLYAGDRIRTRSGSRLVLRWSDQSTVRLDGLSEFQIEAPVERKALSGFSLLQGIAYFFHRDKPADVRIRTRTATAAVRGTEFNLEADENGRTILTLFDGEVELANDQGKTNLFSGEQGVAEPGQPPTKTARIEVINVIQWCLYYPAVLDLDELSLAAAEQQALSESLAAYRSGDLLVALDKYPAGRQPASSEEKVYFSALLLSVGQVQTSASLLDTLPRDASDRRGRSLAALADALRQLIAAVKLQPWESNRAPALATEWLAESYHQQSQARLEAARAAARNAVAISTNFGFGWARLAELEFSFGRTPEAIGALNRSLLLSPRNAEALTLKGFLHAAQSRISEATTSFEKAIAIDPALGNAWLGRGLCKIRRGHLREGQEDLQIAATVEPQRALLRSYLGKAYGDAGDSRRAGKELELAKRLDSRDPTAWLYSALLDQQNNRINEGIRDLEKSQEINDNRYVYRSQLLLDQDRAVRGANLANLYRDAGMFDVSVREASSAVNYDYANYSAHLFLASSYDQLRDPNRINLRYETPAESEYLLANLLAPVGAGMLSQNISQQEYSKLFERDRFGVVSSTEYFSRGAWVQRGAQYGTFGHVSYSVDASYRSDPGQRPNDDFEERILTPSLKLQVTPQDSIFLQATYYEASGGDLIQYYDPNSANQLVRTHENQDPLISLGLHHEWSPGLHTLLLASRLSDRISVQNPTQLSFFVARETNEIYLVEPISIKQQYRSTLEIYAGELQQIWQTPNHNTIIGGRFQSGEFRTTNLQTHPIVSDFLIFFDPDRPAAQQNVTTDFERISVYGYHHWQVAEPLMLIGGLTYDHITFPKNFRAAPISDEQDRVERLSPKAGLIWTPGKSTTVRAAYTRSVGGASIDQSLQLEPSQIAGFLQSFRSILPESVGGAEAGATFETYGVSFEHKFPTKTYVGVLGEVLRSKVNRTLGVFDANFAGFALPNSMRDHLDYKEPSLLVTLDQLFGKEWAMGMRYRVSEASLEEEYPEVRQENSCFFKGYRPVQHLQATLHQLNSHIIYNHPSGFFGQAQALWYRQNNRGYGFTIERDIQGTLCLSSAPDLPSENVWQFNVFAGYRFPGRHAEVMVGLLNVTDQDYRLNPLTLYNDLPRERTIYVRLQLNF